MESDSAYHDCVESLMERIEKLNNQPIPVPISSDDNKQLKTRIDELENQL